MSKSNTQQVAEAKKTGIAVMNYEDDAGGGFEGADIDSFAIPFLVILQKLSPVCDDDSPARREEAKPGMLMDTVSEKLFPVKMEDGKFLQVIPVAFKRQFLVWGPRDSGKGLVEVLTVEQGTQLANQCTKNDKGQTVTAEGNILADTRMHFVLYHDGEDWQPAIMSMSSTQIKHSKKWMKMMDSIKFKRANGDKYTPAMFSHAYTVQTQPQENAHGTWRGWKIALAGKVETPELYNMAKAFRDQIVANQVEVAYNTIEGESTDNSATASI